MTSTRRTKTTQEKPFLSTEEQLALAIEALSEHVVLFDADDRIVLANKAWRDLNKELTEFTKPGVLFEDYLHALTEKGLAQEAVGREEEWVRERMERHLNPSGPFEVAREVGRWVRVYEQRLPNNGTILIVSDITEIKRADQALHESEERFRAIVNNSPAKVHIKDAEGRYILINPLAEELFGVTEAEALGKTTHEVFPKDLADAFAAHDKGVLESGEVIEQEEVWTREDGTHTYLTVKFPILNSRGGVIGTGAIGTDITKRKEAEGLSERLGRILDSSFNEIYVFDARTYRFIQVNQGALNNLGYTAQEIVHMTPWDLKPAFGEESFGATVQPLLSGEKDMLVFETEHQRKNGSRYPVEIRLQLSRTETPPVFVAVIADITERRRAREAVHAAKEAAEIANRAKSDFLATMSHELRTPLNAILGFAELIESETFGPIGNPKYREYMGDIRESGQHLLDLINDILDCSKLESGKEDLHEEDVHIPDMVRSLSRLIQQRAEKHGVELLWELQERPPALRADQRKLKQILVNLLTNAIKFTEAGGQVVLKVWHRADSGYIFQVSDTGIGIALDDIPKALSQFGQIDSALTRQQEGTGLGLPLSKALVELHGGSMDLQSSLGVGTSVTVRFPAERILDQPADTQTTATSRRTSD